MKHFLLLLAIASVMVSCSQDMLDVKEINSTEEFTGQMMDGFSRTCLDDNNNVNWETDDEISIFFKTGFHHEYIVKEGAGTNSAKFQYVNKVAEGFPKFDSHYAIYPFSSSYEISDDKQLAVDFSSWATQTYQEGSYESGKSIMTGKSSNTNFPFKNANALVCVKLSSVVPGSYSISSITLSSSEALNGPGVIDLTAVEPIVTFTGTEDSYKCNTLQITEPVILEEEPVFFYILVPAKTYSDFTITINGTDEMEGTPLSWTKTLNNVICYRSKITYLPKQFEAVDFTGSLEGTN